MSQRSNNSCILAIAPTTRGFGFAVLDGETLVNWGNKSAVGNKNRECLRKIKPLLLHYKPQMLVLENYGEKGSRRAPRIKRLGTEILSLAKSENIRVQVLSKQKVRKT